MSNKLVKRIKRRKFPFQIHFVILLILMAAFIGVWFDVATSTSKFHQELDSMIVGKDYYYEEVEIINKAIYSGITENGTSSASYYLYYSADKKLYVDNFTYDKYEVGDTIKAYTPDHEFYYFTKEGLLGKRRTYNELKKCAGYILGIIIASYFLILFLSNLKLLQRRKNTKNL